MRKGKHGMKAGCQCFRQPFDKRTVSFRFLMILDEETQKFLTAELLLLGVRSALLFFSCMSPQLIKS